MPLMPEGRFGCDGGGSGVSPPAVEARVTRAVSASWSDVAITR